jgi:membrane protein YdbS with pleckstrin-like domain
VAQTPRSYAGRERLGKLVKEVGAEGGEAEVKRRLAAAGIVSAAVTLAAAVAFGSGGAYFPLVPLIYVSAFVFVGSLAALLAMMVAGL